MCAPTWLGPPAADEPIHVGPVRIERWQRQPQRTLLFGAPSRGKHEERPRIGPGLLPSVAVSKGHPSGHDSLSLCAGVRLDRELSLGEGAPGGGWYAPCDVKISLVGDKCSDFSRTVRWVFTPQNNEIFFAVLPLAEVGPPFVAAAGALRVRAELRFHLAEAREVCGGPLAEGLCCAPLRAIVCGLCLAGPGVLREAGRAGGAARDVGRGGPTGERSGRARAPRGGAEHALPPAPGLLPPCEDLPCALAQEVFPGLLVGSEGVMVGDGRQRESKVLVELHSAGVGWLLEVGGLSGPALEFTVRLLKLRGCRDTVELVEDSASAEGEARSAAAVVELVEAALDQALTGTDAAWQALVFPREPRDGEACAALVAAVVARRFGLRFAEAQRYVRTRWDAAIGEGWGGRLAQEGGPLAAEAAKADGVDAAGAAGLPGLLGAVGEAFQRDDADGVLSRFAAWFSAAHGSAVSFRTMLEWEHVWEPLPGEQLRVHDTGWGSISEVFRAAAGCGGLTGAVVTLRMMSTVPRGEILEVPHLVQTPGGGEVWHLLALVCGSCAGHRCVAFLRGGGEWMLDGDGQVYTLVRRPTAGSGPDQWLCTSDVPARAAVYVKGHRAQGVLRPAVPAAPGVARPQPAPGSRACTVRVVTEKMLQRASGGGFAGGACIAASAWLSLPQGAGLQALQDRVHQALKIPPARQLLLHLPDELPQAGARCLFRVDDAFCSQLAAGTGTATVLLMFVPGAEAERGEPGELAEPMLCQFFDKLTLRCLVLGVALVPQADSLLQHAEWIRRRLALLTRSPQHDAPLACCSGALAEGAAPVRMDAPLCEQQVVSGCALTFETAPCGRRGASQARGPEQCGAVLAQLVHQPPPVTIHGCVSLDARSRSSADLDAWSAFHRLFCEEVSKEVSLELLPAAASGPGPARAGSVMIFRILPHRNMAAASAVAVELCTLFSTPKEGGKRCLCRGRFARHRPRELLLTAGTACGGARALWRAHAPGVGARGSAEFGHLANREATSLTAMLHSMGVPVGEVEVFEVGPPPGCDTLPATTVELEESPSEGVKSRRSRRKAQAAREAQAADCAGAEDCGGSPAAERPAHECRSGRRPSSTELEEPAELASAVESAEDDDDEAEAEEAQSHQGSTIDGASGASHHRPSFNLSASTEEIGGADAVAPQPTATPCPDFAAAGLCLEGARCPFAHPRGAQLARPEPCPLRSESRERCALRHLCAFAHGEAERACPPYIRARPPGGERQSAASPGEGQAHGPAAAEDTASGLVRRLLHQSTEQLCGLLEQARALSMTEEVEGVERQLLPLFLHRGPVQSQKATPVARSVALSRSSSCDSFFDEPGGRDAAQAARLLLAQAAAGEATQPSTPRSLTHTPGGHAARPQPDSGGKSWPPEGDALETARSQISALLLPLGSAAPVPSAASQPPLELPAEARHAPSSSPLHRYADEPHADQPLRSRARDESERLVVRPPRLDRRPGAVGGGVQSMGYLWHTSPFCISRTPNIHTPAIHTPVSHCSPARSPASFSGYCSPITAMPSGVASPNQRRSQSGYSSPSADRGLLGSAFFVGTATAHSGLMRRLMSLREARGEDNEEESEWSSGDEVPGGADAGMPDLLDNLLQNAQRLPLSRGTKEPSCLCLDLSTEFSGYMKRGLVMNRAAPYLNAFLQVLLPCSPLMHLLAQLSWSSLAKQRPAYACLVQIAGKFFGTGHRVGAEERNIGMAASADGPPSPQGGGWRLSAADPSGPQGVQPPVDAAAFAEPLLRRFERGKNTSAPTPPAPGLVETFLHFVHFVLGQLHDECKWPTLSPITGHHEDSPVSRIFECLLRRPKAPQRTAADASAGAADTVPLLVLHLDLASAPCLSVSEALQQLLRPPGSHFIRLPPFLLLHLQRFKMVDGVPTKISRHCTMDTWLQLEEAAHCTSRTVTYELRSAACHYGEAPEGGTYKALARSGAPPRGAALGGALGAATAGGAGDWYAFDDAAVRLRPAEELGALLQCEGHHVCFLVYRREDTRTVNMRPHAA